MGQIVLNAEAVKKDVRFRYQSLKTWKKLRTYLVIDSIIKRTALTVLALHWRLSRCSNAVNGSFEFQSCRFPTIIFNVMITGSNWNLKSSYIKHLLWTQLLL